jgi:hypothetical protein
MQMVAFEWVLYESGLDEQVRAIEVSGGTVEDSGMPFRPRPDEAGDYQTAGFEPLTMIAATASVVYLAESVQKLIKNRKTVSTLIDVRKGIRIRPVQPCLPVASSSSSSRACRSLTRRITTLEANCCQKC